MERSATRDRADDIDQELEAAKERVRPLIEQGRSSETMPAEFQNLRIRNKAAD